MKALIIEKHPRQYGYVGKLPYSVAGLQLFHTFAGFSRGDVIEKALAYIFRPKLKIEVLTIPEENETVCDKAEQGV